MDKHSLTFYVLGYNNILCHLRFFQEINLYSPGRTVYRGLPNVDADDDKDFYDNRFPFFLPVGAEISSSYKKTWQERGIIALVDYLGGDIIYVKKNHSLQVGESFYNSDPERLKKILFLVNRCRREKIMAANVNRAYDFILESLNYRMENPYLESAVRYLKGDLEVLQGRYREGEKTLRQAIACYPGNSDAVQRICEIPFLEGYPSIAVEMADNEFRQTKKFWGMGSGKSLFKAYCHLQLGNFSAAADLFSTIVNSSEKASLKCYEGIVEIFKGDYHAAVSDLKGFEKEFVYNFTVPELRLLIGRAWILADRQLERARFYFEDMLSFGGTRAHLAVISAAFFQAKDGRLAQAETAAMSGFERLRKLAAGNFETRLWLFYDAYMYGRIMEMCGNKNEAARGYRECIQANPHTDLANQSAACLRRLE